MPVSRRRCRSGYRRSKVDRRKCVKSRRTASRSRKTASRKTASRRRCRAGYRRSKVDKRKCVRSRSKSKRKRCPKGSRRNKKTRKCEKKEDTDTDTDTDEGEAEFIKTLPASAARLNPVVANRFNVTLPDDAAGAVASPRPRYPPLNPVVADRFPKYETAAYESATLPAAGSRASASTRPASASASTRPASASSSGSSSSSDSDSAEPASAVGVRGLADLSRRGPGLVTPVRKFVRRAADAFAAYGD
jgi:hypothetical protein